MQSSRDSWLASRQMMHTSEACREDEQSCQLEHYRTKSPVWQFCLLAAWTRDSVKSRDQATSQPALFWKTWLFAFHSHSNINTPHTHKILRASGENIGRETLEKNKIDSSIIFTYRLFKFLYSHPLHCYILKRFIIKTFSHHTHICEKALWCLESS